jgi:hypothetical protein
MTATITVLAVRYCADVPGMTTFFETLGLTRVLSSEHGHWTQLRAGDGLVMLHAAGNAHTGMPVGTAELSFEVDDLAAAEAVLAPLDPISWDESYGRHLGIRDPHGDGIWINERQHDLYGFRRHEGGRNDLNLLAVRFSEDFAADAAFYAQLGYEARPSATDDFSPLEGRGAAHGVVGLHPPNPGWRSGPNSPDNPVSPPAVISLSFETHENQAALLARLLAAGVTAEPVGGPAPHVHVTDPEGADIEIHIAP